MNTNRQGRSWTHLCHDDDTDGFVVTTKEGDRFIVGFDDLVKACKTHERGKEFLAQFKEVFQLLNGWLDRHDSLIHSAYLSFKPEGISFIVIQKSKEFEPELDESLVDLDIEVARSDEFDAIRLDVLALPYTSEDSIRSFVRQSGTMKRQFD